MLSPVEPRSRPPPLPQGKNLPPWDRQANSSIPWGTQREPHATKDHRALWARPRRLCFPPGQPPALPNPCQSLEERGVSLRPFLLLIKSWIRPDLSPGPSWSLEDQRSWFQKAQGPAWLGQRQVAWQVVTGLLAGFQALSSWALAVLWAETSQAGPLGREAEFPAGGQEWAGMGVLGPGSKLVAKRELCSAGCPPQLP